MDPIVHTPQSKMDIVNTTLNQIIVKEGPFLVEVV
jgi:hypothetical protein